MNCSEDKSTKLNEKGTCTACWANGCSKNTTNDKGECECTKCYDTYYVLKGNVCLYNCK